MEIDKETLHHLLQMINQFCYSSFEEDNKFSTRFSADARAADFLVKQGYAEYFSDKHWPDTKYCEFRLTEKGWELLNSNIYN